MNIQKTIQEKMNKIFHEHLPDTLYMSHYELSEYYDGSPEEWRRFLRQPDIARFIEMEMASIAEAQARQALQRLSRSGSLASSDISALKSIIENSKLLKQKSQNKTQVVIMHHDL